MKWYNLSENVYSNDDTLFVMFQAFVRDPDGYYIEFCNCQFLEKFLHQKMAEESKAPEALPRIPDPIPLLEKSPLWLKLLLLESLKAPLDFPASGSSVISKAL